MEDIVNDKIEDGSIEITDEMIKRYAIKQQEKISISESIIVSEEPTLIQAK